MNELDRQSYLSALGIENYMPRWRLPCAPEPVVCFLPIVEIDNSETFSSDRAVTLVPQSPIASISVKVDSVVTINALASLDVRQQSSNPINAAAILQQLEEKKAPAIAPFSLSLWRPEKGFLIIDSRNTAMALPTEQLLNNVLRAVLGSTKYDLKEEVLRWPMIENRFVSRTEVDARNELQTWLAVENELRPINRLWLLGENAIQFFMATNISIIERRWEKVPVSGLLSDSPVEALLLPGLTDFLQNPIFKSRLWAALN